MDQSNLQSCRRPKVTSEKRKQSFFVITQHKKTGLLFIDEIELKTKTANGDGELLKI